jgi:hypothetical protein
MRFLVLAAGALLPCAAAVRTAWSQERAAAAQACGEQTCVIYSLADLCDDADMGKWIADTIPEVIEPGSWAHDGGQRQMLRYYAPKKILVVYHTAAVQAKVDAFLKDMKKTAAVRPAEPKRDVAQADYREPAPPRAQDAVAESGVSYSVPPPVRPPKHLFHMIIRYEGDGIIDDNVVKMIQAQSGGASCGTPTAAPAACLPLGVSLPIPGISTSSSPQPTPTAASPAQPQPQTPPAPKPAENVEEKKEEKSVAPDDSSAKTTKKDEKD